MFKINIRNILEADSQVARQSFPAVIVIARRFLNYDCN